MGASGSIQYNPDKTIYVSYDNTCKLNYTECVQNLAKKNYTILEKNIDNILLAKYVIVFISNNTITSAKQCQDIHISIENNKKIIYLITDEDYLPEKNAAISTFISTNSYYPFYNKDTAMTTIALLSSTI